MQDTWLPIEREQGDGDPVKLESFLAAFLASHSRPVTGCAPASPGAHTAGAEAVGGTVPAAEHVSPGAPSTGTDPGTRNGGLSPLPEASQVAARAASQMADSMCPKTIFSEFAALLRARGGASGAASLYEAGSATANAGDVVEGRAAREAALALLVELREASTRDGAPLFPEAQVATASYAFDLMPPERALERALAEG